MPSPDTLTNTFRLLTAQPGNGWPWKLWVRRYHTRRQLKALSRNDPARLLQDLGLHAVAVKAEYEKWFWQA